MPGTTIHTHMYPVQVGQEPALGYIVGMRNVRTYLRAFATDFTTAGHKHYSWEKVRGVTPHHEIQDQLCQLIDTSNRK